MEYLKKMGISTLHDERDAGLSTAIGGLTYGVSPLEMAGAYASIANNGNYIEPTFYSKVEDSDGNVVLEPNQKTEKVCSEDTAYVVKDLLKSVVNEAIGTATYCKISGIDVAAKTGTTNDDYDRWLCGFTNYYAGATWFGFDQQEDVDFGGNPAGLIFDGVMTAIHKGLPESRFEKTNNIVTARVCTTSGRLATDKCTSVYSEIFIKGNLPETCDAHDVQFAVCSESGLLPNEYCPSTTTKSGIYIIETERTDIWDTVNVSKSGEVAPTDYCTIHKKPEVVEPVIPDTPTVEEPVQKPEENPQEKPEQKPEPKPEENTPVTPPTETDKPNEDQGTTGGENAGNTGNTGDSENTSGENKPQT